MDQSISLFTKKAGLLSFFVYYCKLNSVDLIDSYSLLHKDGCNDSLDDTRIFSVLDANAGYWQVEIDERDNEKTSPTIHLCLYQLVRILYRLNNVHFDFRQEMDPIASVVKEQSTLIDLDDVVVSSKTVERHCHLNHSKSISTLLQEAGVALGARKCFFSAEINNSLGCVNSPNKLEIVESATDNIRQLQDPWT